MKCCPLCLYDPTLLAITRHLTTQSETKPANDLPWEGSLKPSRTTSSSNSTADLEKAIRDALHQPKAFDDKSLLLSKLWSVDEAELQKSISLWNSAFELGFQQSKFHHKDDLKTVIRVFEKTFKVSQVQDKELLESLVKVREEAWLVWLVVIDRWIIPVCRVMVF